MTADQIERRVERRMDLLDRHFLAGRLTQAEYDSEVKALNKWAEKQYELIPIYSWR
jgi:hypothetical protein